MRVSKKRSLAVLVVMGLLVAVACAGMHHAHTGTLSLIPAASSVHFIGIKNNAAAVPGSFSGLAGELDLAKRSGWLEVSIGSLDTGLEPRDLNIRSFFFESDSHPTARFDVAAVSGDWPHRGESLGVTLEGTLTLHGNAQAISIPATVARQKGGLRISSRGPVVLTAIQFDMQDQLAALKTACGHGALSGAVPVQFDVVFGKP